MSDRAASSPVPPPFDALVRQLLTGTPAPWPSGTSPDETGRFLRILNDQGISPLVYRLVMQATREWPADLISALRDIAFRNASIEAMRFADFRTLTDELTQRGFRFLVIKGGALAYVLYPSAELRPRCDTDLWISPSDRHSFSGAMRESGYEPVVSSEDELGLRQQTFGKRDANGREQTYDIHWDVTNHAVFEGMLRWDEVMSRSSPFPGVAPHARVPSAVDSLLIACVHRVAHHHDADRLIWLCDIHLLFKSLSSEERERFRLLAAERKVAEICQHSLKLAAHWFGGDLDPALEETTSSEEIASIFLDSGMRRGSLLARNLAALPEWRSRLRRMRQLALPPPSFIRSSFGVRGRLSLPWFYAWRGLRGLARLFRRVE